MFIQEMGIFELINWWMITISKDGSQGFREVEYDIPRDGGNDTDVRKYKVYAGYE